MEVRLGEVEIRPKLRIPSRCWRCGSSWIVKEGCTNKIKCRMCGQVL